MSYHMPLTRLDADIAKSGFGKQTGSPFYGYRFLTHCNLLGRVLYERAPGRHRVFAATHIVGERPEPRLFLPTPVEDAFSIIYLHRPLEDYHRKRGATHVFQGRFPAGAATYLDMRSAVETSVSGTVDATQIYFTRDLLDQFSEENDLKKVEGLQVEAETSDVVIGQLLRTMSILDHLAPTSRSQLVEQMINCFLAHFALRYCQMAPAVSTGSGLAPWQERRARDIIEAQFDTSLSVSDLARECRLSESRFAQAFKKSFGMPPHAYMIGVRISRAKDMIRSGGTGLAEVALRCGFSDQSHLARVFSRSVGMSPSQWRRQNEDTPNAIYLEGCGA